jgi:hypothetical protein
LARGGHKKKKKKRLAKIDPLQLCNALLPVAKLDERLKDPLVVGGQWATDSSSPFPSTEPIFPASRVDDINKKSAIDERKPVKRPQKIGGKTKVAPKVGPWGYGELVALRKVVHMLQNRSITDEGHFESLTTMMIPGRKRAEIEKMRCSEEFLKFLRGHGVGMIFNNNNSSNHNTKATETIKTTATATAAPSSSNNNTHFDLSRELRKRAMAGLDGSIGLKGQPKTKSPSKPIAKELGPFSTAELLRMRMTSSLDQLLK